MVEELPEPLRRLPDAAMLLMLHAPEGYDRYRGNWYRFVVPPFVQAAFDVIYAAFTTRFGDPEHDDIAETHLDYFDYLEDIESVIGLPVTTEGEPLADPTPCWLCHKTADKYAPDPCIGQLPDPTIVNACCGHGREQPVIVYEDPPNSPDPGSKFVSFEGAEAAERLWPDVEKRTLWLAEMARLVEERRG